MRATGLAVFDETVQKTNTWLKEIAQVLGCVRHRAYTALRAVLHCLHDRLTIDEAAQLGDQLPTPVRGIYFKALHPAGKPAKIRSREDFLVRAETHLTNSPIEPEDATHAVFQVLEKHVSPDKVRGVIQVLPKEIRTLWPKAWVIARDTL
jgi:uncharacterized protein (DUF2267 family)